MSPPLEAEAAKDAGGAESGRGGGGGNNSARTPIDGLGTGGTRAPDGGVTRIGDIRFGVSADGGGGNPIAAGVEMDKDDVVGGEAAAAMVARLLGEDIPVFRVFRARAAALASAVASARALFVCCCAVVGTGGGTAAATAAGVVCRST